MKAAIFKNGKIELTDFERPMLNGRTGAIVKVHGCGLCGSDIVKYKNQSIPDGTVLGHEIVGEIFEINSKTNFKTGDKIISSHHIPCFECKYCKNHNYSMCRHFKSTNIFPGGFAEYIYLSEEHLQNVAHLIPDNLTDEEAAFYEPLGCCVRAIKRCDLPKNSNVLVIGLGSIGYIMAQGLKAFGMNVYGCDLIDDRINKLKSVGIEAFNSADYDTAVARLEAAVGITPEDICWDIGAGSGSVSVELALQTKEVWAVEREAEALTLAERNKERFRAWNLHLLPGEAPEALDAFPKPDAVFVGGSGGRLKEILCAIHAANPAARVCVSAIALETLEAATRELEALGYATEITQLSVSRSRKAGKLHMMMAQNAVWLITGRQR